MVEQLYPVGKPSHKISFELKDLQIIIAEAQQAVQFGLEKHFKSEHDVVLDSLNHIMEQIQHLFLRVGYERLPPKLSYDNPQQEEEHKNDLTQFEGEKQRIEKNLKQSVRIFPNNSEEAVKAVEEFIISEVSLINEQSQADPCQIVPQIKLSVYEVKQQPQEESSLNQSQPISGQENHGTELHDQFDSIGTLDSRPLQEDIQKQSSLAQSQPRADFCDPYLVDQYKLEFDHFNLLSEANTYHKTMAYVLYKVESAHLGKKPLLFYSERVKLLKSPIENELKFVSDPDEEDYLFVLTEKNFYFQSLVTNTYTEIMNIQSDHIMMYTAASSDTHCAFMFRKGVFSFNQYRNQLNNGLVIMNAPKRHSLEKYLKILEEKQRKVCEIEENDYLYLLEMSKVDQAILENSNSKYHLYVPPPKLKEPREFIIYMSDYFYKKSKEVQHSILNFLYKDKSHIKKLWKRKFVILSPLGIHIYSYNPFDKQLMSTTQFKRKTQVTNTRILELDDTISFDTYKRHYVFKLVDMEDNAEIILAAGTKEVFQKWCSALKSVTRKAPSLLSQSKPKRVNKK